MRNRIKMPARLLLRRAGYALFKDRNGYTLFRDRLPSRPIELLPVELAAHRLMLRALLESLAVNCVIDVGAHTGGYGSELRKSGYRGEIVSFEPVSASFAALQHRAKADPNWQTHRLALGRTSGSAKLYVAREPNFSSFLQPTRFSLDWFGGSAVEREEEVNVQRLDAIFDRITAHVSDPRVLLKTDTQGWDLEVIHGARSCLNRLVALQVELSVRAVYDGQVGLVQALASLQNYGFQPAHLTTVTRDESLGIVELDCLAIRAQA
jgi:FkbM family methyltransferase